MNYELYLDESGDLGLGAGGSDYFIIAGLLVPLTSSKAVERLIPNIKNKKNLKHIKDFKYSKCNFNIKTLVLSKLNKIDYIPVILVLNKEKNANVIFKYNRCNSQNLIKEKLFFYMLNYCFKEFDYPSRLVIDKYLTANKIKLFNKSFKNTFNLDLIIEHLSSNNSLICADFLAGAFANKYNRKDLSLVNNICKKYVFYIKLDCDCNVCRTNSPVPPL